MAVYTEEEVFGHQARRWGTTIEAVRAMNPAENMHNALYGAWSGPCLIARDIRKVAEATLLERQTSGFEAVLSLVPHRMQHLIFWGSGPCPEIHSDEASNPDDYEDIEPRQLWSGGYDDTDGVNLSTRVHRAVYGWRVCPTADRIRHIAEASLTERQTILCEEIHQMTMGEMTHLIVWGAEPCPRYGG